MNRLRKPPTPSGSQKSPSPRDVITNAVTETGARGGTPRSSATSSGSQAFESIRPQTPGEHYWAARALKAETRLTEGLAHNRELKTLRYAEDEKRKVSRASTAVMTALYLT